MKSEIENPYLVIEENDSKINLIFRRPSGYVSKVFYECINQMPKQESSLLETSLILNKYYDTNIKDANLNFMIATNKAIENKEMTMENIKDLITKGSSINVKDKLLINDLYLTMFKAMIDTRQMTNEQKLYVELDNNSYFWQSQDISMIRREVNRFRTLIE